MRTLTSQRGSIRGVAILMALFVAFAGCDSESDSSAADADVAEDVSSDAGVDADIDASSDIQPDELDISTDGTDTSPDSADVEPDNADTSLEDADIDDKTPADTEPDMGVDCSDRLPTNLTHGILAWTDAGQHLALRKGLRPASGRRLSESPRASDERGDRLGDPANAHRSV